MGACKLDTVETGPGSGALQNGREKSSGVMALFCAK